MNQQTTLSTVDRNAADYAAICAVLRDYFDGLYHCDTKKVPVSSLSCKSRRA